MHTLYFMLRVLPYWALPMAFCFGQVGLYFRRRRNAAQFPLYGASLLLIVASALWIYFRGDVHVEQWIRWIRIQDPV